MAWYKADVLNKIEKAFSAGYDPALELANRAAQKRHVEKVAAPSEDGEAWWDVPPMVREEQETSSDEHAKALERVKALEGELVASAAAVQKALEDAQAKDAAHASESEAATKVHQEQLEKAVAETTELQGKLSALQAELAQAIAANEQAKTDAQLAAEEHLSKLTAADALRAEIEANLQAEIARITADLEVRIVVY